ncbi:MAG: LapA family protein [Acidimicrobiales bacterium]
MAEPIGDDATAGVDNLRRRRRRLGRALAVLAVAVVVIAFVVENSKSVAVRFWFATGHPRLIWVIVSCLAGGAVLGYLVGRPVRARRRARRAAPSGSALRRSA